MESGLEGIMNRREFLRVLGTIAISTPLIVQAKEEGPFKVYFVDKYPRGNIWVIDDNGQNLERVTNLNSKEKIDGAAVSPDGKFITYGHINEDKQNEFGYSEAELHILNLSSTRVTSVPCYAQCSEITWSLDGKKIAFVEGIHEGSDILIITSDGTRIGYFSANNGSDRRPSFSPDGNHITYSSNGGVFVDKKLVKEENIPRNVGFNYGTRFSPIWSQRGDMILFLSNREKEDVYKLYTMSPDGSNQELLAPDEFTEMLFSLTQGMWSPDGRRMAIQWNGSISVIDIYSRERTHIMDRDYYTGSRPVHWSPDGKKLAFVRGDPRDLKKVIYTMNVDGTGIRELKKGAELIIGYAK